VLVGRLRAHREVAGVILFGSYARGDFGRSSDVDLLLVVEGATQPGETNIGAEALRLVGEVEAEMRLPMHLAPLIAAAERPSALGPDLLHAIWTEGVILYARAGVVARLQPAGLAPWTLVRFSVARARPTERVRLSRRLHGVGGRPGLLRPPASALGPGALLLPAGQQEAVRAALDDAGASYDLVPIWREV